MVTCCDDLPVRLCPSLELICLRTLDPSLPSLSQWLSSAWGEHAQLPEWQAPVHTLQLGFWGRRDRIAKEYACEQRCSGCISHPLKTQAKPASPKT